MIEWIYHIGLAVGGIWALGALVRASNALSRGNPYERPSEADDKEKSDVRR